MEIAGSIFFGDAEKSQLVEIKRAENNTKQNTLKSIERLQLATKFA